MDLIIGIDLWLLHMINAPAGQWPAFDRFVHVLRDGSLLKAGPLVVLWWWLWFARRDAPQARARLLAVLLISVPAIALGRALALTMPFRFRPLHEPGLSINLPVDMPERMLTGWSSMPSDHAVMFLSIAVALLFVSRRAGWLAISFATVLVCLPRIYSGLHYPSDILVGGLAGALVAVTLMPWLSRAIAWAGLDRLPPVRHASLTALAALMSINIATMYEMPRGLLISLGLY